MPSYEVQLSWVATGIYEVRAADEDAAIMDAIERARREDAAPDEVTLEAIDATEGAAP